MQLRFFLIFFLVLVQTSFSQTPPIISYPKVQSFTKNVMISPLFPSNTGGLVKDNLQVSTLAGNGLRGFNDGPGKDATFMHIDDITVDSNDNVFVIDGRLAIRKITPAGYVSTFAGTYYDPGIVLNGVDGIGTAAVFGVLKSIITDANDDMFVIDLDFIRKITKNAKVTTVFKNVPSSVGFDLSSTGDFYIAQFFGNKIQKITPAGVYTIIAGNGNPGYVDGTGLAASFHSVVDLKLDNNGVIYVTEPNNNTIRKIDPSGVVTTFAGSSSAGFVNGTGVTAKFDYPWDITFDAHSNLYVADALNAVIRKITPAGVVSTYAGNGLRGDVDGPALNASIDYLRTLVCGKDGTLYFANNNKVKKITNEPYYISPSLPSGLSFDKMTGVISGTAVALLSPTKFSITATNEFGSSTFDIIISVNDILPSLTYPLQNLVVKGEEIAPIVPTNSGGEVISYSIGPNLPLGLVFNTKTGVISGTPTVVQADSTYTIVAENTGGRVSFDLSLTVIDSFKMDTDKDGIADLFDNCPFKFNPNQLDSNNNQIGDACETNSLVVSKIISPNGDGVNDTWMIYNIENYPGLSISVFNRFGQQVYHSDDYKNDWNANELQESTYFYTIFSSFEDKKIELKGWFYIIK